MALTPEQQAERDERDRAALEILHSLDWREFVVYIRKDFLTIEHPPTGVWAEVNVGAASPSRPMRDGAMGARLIDLWTAVGPAYLQTVAEVQRRLSALHHRVDAVENGAFYQCQDCKEKWPTLAKVSASDVCPGSGTGE